MIYGKDLLLEAVRNSWKFTRGGSEPTFAVGTFQMLTEVL